MSPALGKNRQKSLIFSMLFVILMFHFSNSQVLTEEDSILTSETLIPSISNQTKWIQTGFKKSFLLSNKSANIFVQVNFPNITSSEKFPLVTLCLNFICYFSPFGNNLTFNLEFYKDDFLSYYFKKNDHFITLLENEYNADDQVYLTIFNLFDFNDSKLEYTISYLIDPTVSDCSIIWSNDDCTSKTLSFKPTTMDFNTDYNTIVGAGKPKSFFSSYSSDKTDMIFSITSSTNLFFLKKKTDATKNNDSSLFDLNSLNLIYVQKSLSTNLSSFDLEIPLTSLDFLLVAPWSLNINNSIATMRISAPINSAYDMNLEKIRDIIYTVVTLGSSMIIIALIFLTMTIYLRHKRAQRTAILQAAETRITSDLLNKYFPLRGFNEFKLESNQHECCICLQNFGDADFCRELYCFHVFHQSCIDMWILEHQTCPFCRKEFVVAKLEKEKIEFFERNKIRRDATDRNTKQNLITISNGEENHENHTQV